MICALKTHKTSKIGEEYCFGGYNRGLKPLEVSKNIQLELARVTGVSLLLFLLVAALRSTQHPEFRRGAEAGEILHSWLQFQQSNITFNIFIHK